VTFAPLHGTGPQVEQHKRIIRPLDQITLEDLEVPLELPGLGVGIGIAIVPGDHIGPLHLDLRRIEARPFAALVLMAKPYDSKVEEILTTDECRLPRIRENQAGATLCDAAVIIA
jgi:hypothetical protein